MAAEESYARSCLQNGNVQKRRHQRRRKIVLGEDEGSWRGRTDVGVVRLEASRLTFRVFATDHVDLERGVLSRPAGNILWRWFSRLAYQQGMHVGWEDGRSMLFSSLTLRVCGWTCDAVSLPFNEAGVISIEWPIHAVGASGDALVRVGIPVWWVESEEGC